jgi:galactose oxidase
MRRVPVVRPVLLPLWVGAVVALAFVACERTPEPTSPPRTLGLESLAETIDLTYACGNKFLISNHNSSAIEVTWRVRGADEEGVRVLPPAPAADPGFSEIVVETTRDGTLELYVEGQRVRSQPNDTRPCPTPPAASHSVAASSAVEAGEWSEPFALPIVAVHLHLLPNGKVLLFSHEHPQVWNRSANTFTQLPPPHWLYCAGHAFLSDGRLLVAGGHLQNNHGLPDAGLFSYSTESWSVIPPMGRGRWYPTLTTLGTGQVVAIAGRDQNARHVFIPEVWTGSRWRSLSGASLKLPYYPRAFLAPNGRVFYAGELQQTYYLSTSGTGSWTYVGDRLHGDRNYGSAVMYEPGKVLYAGGGHTTNTAEVIDLNQATPRWEGTGSMTYARRQLNATVLPDGTVLVTGGSSGITQNDETQPVYAAELWNPATGTWTVLASNAVVRVLHSSALLLPDGRVLLAGGGEAVGATDHRDGELFSPPYLFKGARPRISSAPATTLHGQSFTVRTPDAASIAKVAWVRLGSVTHAFDQNQRYVPLGFTRTGTGVVVTPPASRNVAPRGHYMLFLLNTDGVPSVARIQRVK